MAINLNALEKNKRNNIQFNKAMPATPQQFRTKLSLRICLVLTKYLVERKNSTNYLIFSKKASKTKNTNVDCNNAQE